MNKNKDKDVRAVETYRNHGEEVHAILTGTWDASKVVKTSLHLPERLS